MFGLALVAQTFHFAFVIVKWIGVAYLVYLAWKMWTAPVVASEGELPREDSPAKLFLAGMAVTLGNPKIMMFYLALLPTIIDLASVSVVGWVELTVDHGRGPGRHRPRLGARCGAGAQAAEEQARHEDRQPRQRRHHGRRCRRDRGALLRCIEIQVRPACKWQFSALPVLSDPNVRSAPVLENHHFRLGLT